MGYYFSRAKEMVKTALIEAGENAQRKLRDIDVLKRQGNIFGEKEKEKELKELQSKEIDTVKDIRKIEEFKNYIENFGKKI